MTLLLLLKREKIAASSEDNLDPNSAPLAGIDRCIGSPCINIFFTPDTPQVREILTIFSQKNAERTNQPAFVFEDTMSNIEPPKNNLDLVPVNDDDFIYNYIQATPNITNWAISFSWDGTTNTQYLIWYNYSRIAVGKDIYSPQILSFMRGIDEAICNYRTKK